MSEYRMTILDSGFCRNDEHKLEWRISAFDDNP